MKLDVFRTLWGVIKPMDGPWDLPEAVRNIKELNTYTGVEVPLKIILHFGIDKFKDLMRENGMKYIIMVFSDGPVAPADPRFGGAIAGHPKPGPSVQEHLAVFKAQVETAYTKLSPEFINSHSGNDYFTTPQIDEYFTEALKFQKEKGWTVYHETHRKRILYSPWAAREILPKHPELELVADLSHWIAVAETNTEDPVLTDFIKSVAPKVRHVHGRVGYDHGPQVPDPAAPEWLPYTEGHERWWDAIWEAAKAQGKTNVTLTPEHGPPNYQISLPYTRQPVADIWKVNHWIAERQIARFGQKFSGEPPQKRAK